MAGNGILNKQTQFFSHIFSEVLLCGLFTVTGNRQTLNNSLKARVILLSKIN
uniref:Uncharacterized protein n=1 Tax=Anguilla anguilla TaxID=7936 RepID=A0A0E9TMH5_ANGAN